MFAEKLIRKVLDLPAPIDLAKTRALIAQAEADAAVREAIDRRDKRGIHYALEACKRATTERLRVGA